MEWYDEDRLGVPAFVSVSDNNASSPLVCPPYAEVVLGNGGGLSNGTLTELLEVPVVPEEARFRPEERRLRELGPLRWRDFCYSVSSIWAWIPEQAFHRIRLPGGELWVLRCTPREGIYELLILPSGGEGQQR